MRKNVAEMSIFVESQARWAYPKAVLVDHFVTDLFAIVCYLPYMHKAVSYRSLEYANFAMPDSTPSGEDQNNS